MRTEGLAGMGGAGRCGDWRLICLGVLAHPAAPPRPPSASVILNVEKRIISV